MPVTKSAKKALRTATRRKAENVLQRASMRAALKAVRVARAAGQEVTDLVRSAQSALDTAAKKNTIHPNKAARLKSRLAKRLKATPAEPVKKARKAAPKKKVAKAVQGK
jgi:small subunit ribosomal protein S20